ncbi:hypothetical protein P691DRAFT_779782 [Macrolepiota fuliginosa MF-IS2]|uniref:DUF6534 domain-containing protein n=1 Tax=Macrolepiota fuliginosa MF-IS2 TaxID=1400762 RepID=A0A9P5X1A0_9AGAR|nr:hypothetical protein P691DRAFT_779782 [Macrolepiota fuliginosa MF-IS2]
MAATPLPVVPSLDNSYGSLFIGMVVAAGLWGIGTAQAYWYYTTYPKDRLDIKLLVSAVWTLDTLHQALISYLVYFYVVTNYFNPAQLNVQIWVFAIQSVFEMIPCAIVQSFFLMRIWRLSNGKLYLIVLPGLLIIAKFVLETIWICFCFRTKSISDAEARFGPLSQGVNGLAAAGDILLSVTMVQLLYKARTGIRQSDNMLGKLMLYTVNTGVITSLWSILTLIVAVRLNKTYIYGAFYFSIGRLYVNTMLATLNARKSIKEKSTNGGALFMTQMSTIRFDENNKGSRSGGTTRVADDSSRKSEKDPGRISDDAQEDFVAKPGGIAEV